MKKGQIVWDHLIPWIIAIAVLIFGIIFYFILSGKGGGALGYLGDILKFRG